MVEAPAASQPHPMTYGQQGYPPPPPPYGYPPPPPPYGYPPPPPPSGYPPPPAHHADSDLDVHVPIGEAPFDMNLVAGRDRRIRHKFIRKVYCLLFAQLAVTFGICSALALPDATANWFRNHWWVSLVCGLVGFIIICVLLCVPGLAQRSPINLILLFLFSAVMGVLITGPAVFTDIATFGTAMGVTLVLVLSLTLFAWQTRIDFTGCGVYLFALLIGLMIFGFVLLFTHNDVAHTVYASLGAILFSFYIIYDTQLIIGGKHRRIQFSIDDYVAATLSIYVDVINLFLFILDLLDN